MPQSSKTKSYISANPGDSWWGLFKRMKLGAQVSMIISLILILAGALGLVFLQSSLLEESQDIRQQAAVEDGQIVITSQLRELIDTDTTTDATAAGTLAFDENILDLYIDTNELQTNTIRLVFEIWPTNDAGEASTISAITQAPDFEVNPELGLQISDQEIEQNGAGYLVAVTLEPINVSATFSTQEPTQLASIRFQYLSEDAANALFDTATIEENSEETNLPGVAISYDNDQSLVYRYGSTPPEDELQYVARNTFSGPILIVTEDETQDEEDEDVEDVEEETTDEDEEEVSLVNDDEDEEEIIDEEEDEEEIITENQVAKGGQTINTVSCNETCASNHQCDAGLACYSGRCRNPLNLQSSSCEQANPATTATMAERCSQACETHRDCPANMLCHAASQSCRLATNPGSLSCSPATTKTVSALYDDSSSTGSDDTNSGSDATASAQPAATISGSVLEQIEAERAEKLAQEQRDAEAAGSAVNQALGLTLFGIFIPVNILLGGLIALGAVICLFIFLTMQRKSGYNDTKFVSSKRVLTPEEHAAHEKATQEIKDKISALQKVEAHTKSEVATHVAQRPNSATPPVPGMPTQATSATVAQQQPPEPMSRPVVSPVPPAKTSSMLERIKQKNIATPVFSAKKTERSQESAQEESPTQPTNNS
jgi:hypothetical protein